MLSLDSGGQFASAVIDYAFEPVEDPRLTIQIEINGIQTSAVIDTAAPYLVCSLKLATQINLSPFAKLGSKLLGTRLGTIRGDIYRLPVKLIASDGDDLEIEATAVVPDTDQGHWNDAPTFLGFLGCLERLRFAVDPANQKFYFGPCP